MFRGCNDYPFCTSAASIRLFVICRSAWALIIRTLKRKIQDFSIIERPAMQRRLLQSLGVVKLVVVDDAEVAQLVEHWIVDPVAKGSSPFLGI
jgi:hypothetical protein